MKNIHVLPTDKPSRLYKSKITQDIFISDNMSQHGDATYNLNIHITSDEEIKMGDYSFYLPFGVGKNIVIDGELCFHIEAKDGKGSFTQRTYQTLDRNKKIILTTDADLINDGVQAIEDDFLEWFVKNPSCEEVEIELFPKFSNKLYGIIIPKEELKQETLEEAAKRLRKDKYGIFISKDANVKGQLVIDTANAAFLSGMNEGAKWQQGRMYNEEDIIEFAEWINKNMFLQYADKLWSSSLIEYSGCLYTTKELFQLWKEQKPKTVYYE